MDVNPDFMQPFAEVVDLSRQELSAIPDDIIEKQSKSATALKLLNNLIFSIPSEIGLFTSLTLLDISNNFLISIDDAIINLHCLKSLLLRNNQLHEFSFPKDFGLLSNLEELNVSGNCLEEIPPQFLELTQLKTLHLGANRIRDLPSDIRQLSRLEVLYLGGNRLERVPDDLRLLRRLRILNLSANRLSSLPNSLVELRELVCLFVHDNQLRTFPPQLVSLNLAELSIRNNPLVLQFVEDYLFQVPTLTELAGRAVLDGCPSWNSDERLPRSIRAYLATAHRCMNPACRGVYFSARVEHVKFVDFCGKFRLPLMQYLCSPVCRQVDRARLPLPSANDGKMKRIMLG